MYKSTCKSKQTLSAKFFLVQTAKTRLDSFRNPIDEQFGKIHRQIRITHIEFFAQQINRVGGLFLKIVRKINVLLWHVFTKSLRQKYKNALKNSCVLGFGSSGTSVFKSFECFRQNVKSKFAGSRRSEHTPFSFNIIWQDPLTVAGKQIHSFKKKKDFFSSTGSENHIVDIGHKIRLRGRVRRLLNQQQRHGKHNHAFLIVWNVHATGFDFFFTLKIFLSKQLVSNSLIWQ